MTVNSNHKRVSGDSTTLPGHATKQRKVSELKTAKLSLEDDSDTSSALKGSTSNNVNDSTNKIPAGLDQITPAASDTEGHDQEQQSANITLAATETEEKMALDTDADTTNALASQTDQPKSTSSNAAQPAIANNSIESASDIPSPASTQQDGQPAKVLSQTITEVVDSKQWPPAAIGAYVPHPASPYFDSRYCPGPICDGPQFHGGRILGMAPNGKWLHRGFIRGCPKCEAHTRGHFNHYLEV